MPALDTEAQFKFLLCCIKHSAAGKVNFEAVATELSIVSKAAAAKRYERLLKAHDISTAAPRKGAKSNADADSGEGSEAGPKTPASKKRKRAAPASASALAKSRNNNEDEDEDVDTPIKKERGGAKKERNLKKEESDEDIKVEGEDDGDVMSE